MDTNVLCGIHAHIFSFMDAINRKVPEPYSGIVGAARKVSEIRLEERERCVRAVMNTCSKCHGRGKILILLDVGRTTWIPCKRCNCLAAAIRAGGDD